MSEAGQGLGMLPVSARFWVEERVSPGKGARYWAFMYRGNEIGRIHDEEGGRAVQALLVLKTWRNPAEMEPEEGENCMVWVRGGWGCDHVLMNIVYRKSVHGWLEPSGDGRGGLIVHTREHVAAWAPSLAMPFPPDEWGR